MNFKNKKILVGVTGGIAAYKACSLVNSLIADGAEVKAVMTDAAKMFVTTITFQALTNNPVYDNLWESVNQDSVEHITLAHWPDLIIISPITANTIGKIANGIADNLLTTVVMASFPTTKVVLAPAMNTYMWENPFVQENLKKLSDTKKYHVVEPRSGVLACRDEGKGKIADNQEILAAAESLL